MTMIVRALGMVKRFLYKLNRFCIWKKKYQ